METEEPPKKQKRWDKFDTQRFIAYIGDGKITPPKQTKNTSIESGRSTGHSATTATSLQPTAELSRSIWCIETNVSFVFVVSFCSAGSKQSSVAVSQQAYVGNNRVAREAEGVDFADEEELGLSNEAEEAGDAEGGNEVMPDFARVQLGGSPARPGPSPRTPALPPLISVGATYPYLVKTFVYDQEEYVVVELFTNGRPVDAFRIWVPEAQNGVNVATMLPSWFFESNRMIREMNGAGGNESYVQAHDNIVQIARGMFGHDGPLAPPQFIPLRNKIRRDFMEIQRLDYDGKEEVLRNGENYGPVRTFEYVLRITLKTTREMLQRLAKATTQYFGDPDADWVRGGYPAAQGEGSGDGSGGYR